MQIYSFNEANSPDWESGLQNYVNDIKQGKGASKQRYSSRYIGSMVGDVHRCVGTQSSSSSRKPDHSLALRCVTYPLKGAVPLMPEQYSLRIR